MSDEAELPMVIGKAKGADRSSSATEGEWIPVNVPQSSHQRILVDPDLDTPLSRLRRRHQIERDAATEAIETAETEEQRQRAREALEALGERQHDDLRHLQALQQALAPTPPGTG